MKIWIDLRFLKKGDEYSNFVFKISQIIINTEKEVSFNIYLDLPFSHINFWGNCKNIVVLDKPWSLKEQSNFLKILNKENNDLMIFFDYKKPIRYKKKYIMFLANLVEFHYPEKKGLLKKHFDNYLINSNSANASKIICFNELSKTEINDKLNILEDNIAIITPFYNKKTLPSQKSIVLDIKVKYNIKWDYFIYSAWAWAYKNLDRLLEVFSIFKKENIDLSLVIIDDSTIKDLNLRKTIIDNKIQDKIYFVWELETIEKQKIYNHSLWIIFPSLYESFPFYMEEPINFEAKIVSSNIKNVKNIFWDTISYFNPTNTTQMYESILALSKDKKKANYKEIFEKYSIWETAKLLIKVIKEV